MNEDLRSVVTIQQSPLFKGLHSREPSHLSAQQPLSRGHTQNLKCQKSISKISKQIQLDPIQSTFESDKDKKKKNNGGAQSMFQTKIDESHYLRKSSDTYFFEIFNKLKKKCPILIPDTIFIGGGSILSWYFTSQKNGAILKKKSHKLNTISLFKTLYRQSPISVEEDFNDRKINEYLKNEHSSEDERNLIIGPDTGVSLLGGIGSTPAAYNNDLQFGVSPSFQRRNSFTKIQALQLQQTLSVNNKVLDTSDSLYEKTWTLKKILKEMSLKNVNLKLIDKYDQDLPNIAFVKFHSQKSKGMKPFEFFQLLHERLGDVKLIQTYIYTRVSQQIEITQDQPVVALQNTVKQQKPLSALSTPKQSMLTLNGKPQKAKPPKIIPQGGCYFCEYTHQSNIYPPSLIVSKQEVSSDLLVKMHKDGVRIVNSSLNSTIEEKAKIIVSFLENTTHTDIKRAYLKFLQDQNGEIYYLGITSDILYSVKGTEQIDFNGQIILNNSGMPHPPQVLPNDSFVFAGNKIHNDKSKWREAGVPKICYGDFCDYQFSDNHKFLSYRGKKKEFEKNFSFIPDKNKIFNSKFDFTVSGLIVKKIEDNLDVAQQILSKHSIIRREQNQLLTNRSVTMTKRQSENKNQYEEDLFESVKRQDSQVAESNQRDSEDPYGMGLGNPKQMPQFIRKKLYADSYNSLYKAVTVCKSCFLIYSLLLDYFDEIVKATIGSPSKRPQNIAESGSTHPALSQNKWTHSQKLLQKREERSINFSVHKRQSTLQTSPSQFQRSSSAAGIDQQGFNQKTSFIQKNLASVDIANLKGSILLKSQSNVLKIEGYQDNNKPPHQLNSTQSQSFFRKTSIFNQNSDFKSQISRNIGQNSQIILPSTTSNLKFNSTSGKFTIPSFNSGNGKLPSFIKPTESIKSREAPRISYKIINTLNQKQQVMAKIRQQRPLKTVIAKKLGDRLYNDILGKQRDKIKKYEVKEPLSAQSYNSRSPKRGGDGNVENKDLKGSIKNAFSNLFKKQEEKFYLQRAHKSKMEKKKRLLNFFNEVSQDTKKYELIYSKKSSMKLNQGNRQGIGSSLELGLKSKSTPPNPAFKKALFVAGRQNSVLDEWRYNFDVKEQRIEEETTPIISNENVVDEDAKTQSLKTDRDFASPTSNKLISPTSRLSMQNPLHNLLVDIKDKKEIQDSRRKTVFTHNLDNHPQNDDSISKANFAFQSSLQLGIMSLAQKIITQQMEIMKKEFEEVEKYDQEAKDGEKTTKFNPLNQISKGLLKAPESMNQQDQSKRKIRLSIMSTSKKRRNPNITQSVFHHQNLQHIKSVPFYRISTPKAPFYSNELVGENAPDDKYIIPIENYKTMNVDQYADLLNLDKNQIENCEVFFINEHTSMLYYILENSQETANASQTSLNIGNLNMMNQNKNSPSKPSMMGLLSGLQSAIAGTKAGTEEQTPRVPLTAKDQLLNSQSPLPKQASPSGGGMMTRMSLMNGGQQRRRVFHNYIVIMDLFDSFIDKIIFFERICKQNPQPCRFILFNLPGQLYTQYNFKKTEKHPLNNSYYSNCIDLLLFHLHEKNMISCLFEPYSLIGFGTGANVALYYAMQVNDTNENLRSILLFNGFCYLDEMLKDTYLKAIENFQKCPTDLSQMGDYFYLNLIWSSEFIHKSIVSELMGTQNNNDEILMTDENRQMSEADDDVASLKQNTLSAIGNKQPSLQSFKFSSKCALSKLENRNKIDLCKGVLANISIKEKLKYLKMPIINICSKKNCLIPLKHSDFIQKSHDNFEQKVSQLIYKDFPQTKHVPYNPMEKILNETLARSTLLIDGAHDVFKENPISLEKIISDYIEVKAPMKYFLMTSLKGALRSNIYS